MNGEERRLAGFGATPGGTRPFLHSSALPLACAGQASGALDALFCTATSAVAAARIALTGLSVLPGLHTIKAVLSATVVVTNLIFERHSGFCPHRIAAQLAEQSDSYAREEALGYYPALEYLRDRDAVDERLIAALDQLIWLATSLVREELRTRLRPLFASVQIQSMQAVAYSMPQVRPAQPDAAARLAEHLTANRVRFDLLLALLRKGGGAAGLESYIKRVSHRHLSQAFDSIEVANVKVLE